MKKLNTITPYPVARRLRRITNGLLILAAAFLCTAAARKHAPPRITTPKEALGFNLGDDYQMASYTQLEAYWKQLASQSDRLKLVDIGPTAEHRRQYMMIISAPDNIRHLDRCQQIAQQLAHGENLTDDQAHALAHDGKAIVWIDGGLHATETVGSQQEMEWVYQMASRDDPETMRFLNDTILLCVLANPDGQELVSKWYMREKDPEKRSLENLPLLFQHYIGHDNNRDFYMSNMPETTNMNRQLFSEWFPEIVYNHHQTGPSGTVIFMPPFRDPFNYNLDPLIPLDIEAVGTAMHQRLVEEGKGGSVQRSGSNYSTWWNGGLRTVVYFHNMIGLLTEIIGNPTPIKIPLVPDKQLPTSDWPLPVAPQTWHYRQSIDYEITNNRAVTDYASRNRETLLYNSYVMARRSIQYGSQDHWTITPDRIEELKLELKAALPNSDKAKDLYEKVLHDPQHRDARGYVIPSDQADFPTATEFVNALLKNGINILQAAEPFSVGIQKFPAGSYVVKTAQAFRPHILDMFEPQHHPNDFQYPGGPPIPPYDSAGWTLALQMGVQFSRILNDFSGSFRKVDGLLKPPPAEIAGLEKPAGYLISHRINNSFILVNRLLKANCDVYWLKHSQLINGRDFGSGAIWVPAAPVSFGIVQDAAKTLGVDALALSAAPAGESFKLQSQRIALYDQYGGLMPSGWDRWLFEQYEFPFQVVYPQTLDAGDLKKQFDVIVFTDGSFGKTEREDEPRHPPTPENTPEEYRRMLGQITAGKTIPALRKFMDAGGEIIAIGSATRMAKLLGAPVDDYLEQIGTDGKPHPLPRDKFYIPGSLLKMDVDIENPLAYGMPDQVDVFFDNSPVFRLLPTAADKRAAPVGWFSTPTPLISGWAWGQAYLEGGTAVAETKIGAGKLLLFGPEITFRAQPHATFKFLFNALHYATAQSGTALEKEIRPRP
jgi:hypothetical protein